MFLNEPFLATLEANLFTLQSKSRVKKHKYDATRKIQDSWVAKLP
jgi:hypothetical protein